ncbi:MAG: hypothetical protein CMJ31_05115 [Phycisphaerae bacterium]|nr:hypothetical protein [Phycisphaerae bacterium]|tara:strand:- start:182 stop:1006 length:825 start_codon:yes stop_codon:yes gene_type:complete
MTCIDFRKTAAATLIAVCASANAELIISVSNNVGNELGGLVFNDGDMVQTNASGSMASVFFAESNWTSDGDTDAFHILDDGTYLFSSLFNSTIGGVTFDDGDVIRYNPNTGVAETYFITESTFDDAGEDISALSTLADGDIVFSTLADASIGGVAFTSGDLMRYDIDTGTVSFLIVGADLFDDGDANIYGAHANADGTFLLTASTDEMIGGTLFLDGDVFLYDPLTDSATLFFSEAAFGGQNQDIDALYFFIPAPGATSLLAFAGLTAMRRRRC